MSSSEEQEALQKEALEGLVKAVQQRDVLFVLYHLPKLNAHSLNQQELSTKLTPLEIALSLPPDCPRRALIVQLLLLSGASSSKDQVTDSSREIRMSSEGVASSVYASSDEAETAHMLLDEPSIDEAEAWLRQNGLDVEEVYAAAEPAPTTHHHHGPSQQPEAILSTPGISHLDAPDPLRRARPALPTPSPDEARPRLSNETRLFLSAYKTLGPSNPLPSLPRQLKRSKSTGKSKSGRSSRNAEKDTGSLEAFKDRFESGTIQSDETYKHPSTCLSTLGNVSPPPSRISLESKPPPRPRPPPSPPKLMRPPPPATRPSALFISQLSRTTSESSLRAWLEPYGSVLSLILTPPPEGSAGSAAGGSARAEFASEKVAVSARMGLNATKLDGRFVRVELVATAGSSWESDQTARRDEMRGGESSRRSLDVPPHLTIRSDPSHRPSHSPSPSTPFHHHFPAHQGSNRRSSIRSHSSSHTPDPHSSYLERSSTLSSAPSRRKRSRSSSPRRRKGKRTRRRAEDVERRDVEEEGVEHEGDGHQGIGAMRWVQHEDLEEGEMRDVKGEGYWSLDDGVEDVEVEVLDYGDVSAKGNVSMGNEAVTEPVPPAVSPKVPTGELNLSHRSPLPSSTSAPSANRLWVQSLDEEDLASLRRMWEARSRRGGRAA
ncbi:hypothetical protein BCR35DRAFT_300047 [Leucosporidium creatinivorum]|uniref:RRM domain-containing protein n=1 Tax=Leucosporidium creatinivorum TaxID=106004 RepID=A0A1Y2FZP7_9BASI|nr:hypothetical protein BCR35DRAFT_300047 [Leucosporidium creatinivorum]